jgi:hypothetical protein
MAHFAEIDDNNKVLRVLVVDNQHEHRGQEYLAVDCGLGGTWIQTSYNNNFRNKFAGEGDTYDPVLDRFLPTKPFDSWVLDDNLLWNSPIPYPEDGKKYQWDESTVNWKEVVNDQSQN